MPLVDARLMDRTLNCARSRLDSRLDSPRNDSATAPRVSMGRPYLTIDLVMNSPFCLVVEQSGLHHHVPNLDRPVTAKMLSARATNLVPLRIARSEYV